jgi:hypothetical protein
MYYLPDFPCESNDARKKLKTWEILRDLPEPPKRPNVRAWPIGLALIFCGIVTCVTLERYLADISRTYCGLIYYMACNEFLLGLLLMLISTIKLRPLFWWIAVAMLLSCVGNFPFVIGWLLISTIWETTIPWWTAAMLIGCCFLAWRMGKTRNRDSAPSTLASPSARS